MSDIESQSQDDFLPAFADKEIRRRFVSKVYLILTVQLAFTSLLVFGIQFNDESHEFAYDYFWIGIIFGVLGMIIYISLVCCACARRNFPLNIILVVSLTICEAVFCAWIAAQYSIMVVAVAFGSTAFITISISLLARFICDVTGWIRILYFAFVALMIFGLVSGIISFFIYIPILHFIYSAIAVVLLSVYLLIITQMILGGRKGEIDPDEVIIAVIILYVSIIEIFIHLLQLIGACFEE